MTAVERFQPKCYFLTPEFARSFWGKFIWIYQGSGSLRLTAESLELVGRSRRLEIPLTAIKAVGLEEFSRWSKPFGLSRLVVQYRDGEEDRAICLVPFQSNLAPTWVTSRLVEDWLGTLGRVDLLADRVQPPSPRSPPRPTIGSFTILLAIGIGLVLLAVGIVSLLG